MNHNFFRDCLSRTTLLPAFGPDNYLITIGKQPNFIRQESDTVFGLAGACADKIQLRSKSASASSRIWSHASAANAQRVATT